MERAFDSMIFRMGNAMSAEVRYFSPSAELHFEPPKERLRIAIITSIRDLLEEHVGTETSLPEGRTVYVKGTLERAIDELREGELRRYIELVAIITDDTEKDLKKSGYPLQPTKGMPWVHPLNLPIDGRTYALELYWHVPSRYRLLKRAEKEKRATGKQTFEAKIRSIMEFTDAEVLVSDHFLCQIEHLIRKDSYNLFGKVLNTHPGITQAHHPFEARGKEPYQKAIQQAKANEVDPISGQRKPESEQHFLAGSSFHVINDEFDAGAVLCDTEMTVIHPNDHILSLAARNYLYSKPMAFRRGLMHYASHVWPRLSSIDWNNLQEIRRMEQFQAS